MCVCVCIIYTSHIHILYLSFLPSRLHYCAVFLILPAFTLAHLQIIHTAARMNLFKISSEESKSSQLAVRPEAVQPPPSVWPFLTSSTPALSRRARSLT